MNCLLMVLAVLVIYFCFATGLGFAHAQRRPRWAGIRLFEAVKLSGGGWRFRFFEPDDGRLWPAVETPEQKSPGVLLCLRWGQMHFPWPRVFMHKWRPIIRNRWGHGRHPGHSHVTDWPFVFPFISVSTGASVAYIGLKRVELDDEDYLGWCDYPIHEGNEVLAASVRLSVQEK